MKHVDRVDVDSRQQPQIKIQVDRKSAKKLRGKIAVIGLISLLIVGAVLSGIGSLVSVNKYHSELSLAKAGIQHLQNAETYLAHLQQSPFDTYAVSSARQEFVAALRSFTRVDGDLRDVPEIAVHLPVYGNQIHAALHLLPLARTLSQAGIAGCDLLNVLIVQFHNPLNSRSAGITTANLSVIAQKVHAIQPSLTEALNEVNQLQPADMQLDPRINKLVNVIRGDVPMMQKWLVAVENILPVAPRLLGIGRSTNYLIEILDVTELRPGGGFIGNYGTATLVGGALKDAHITDIDLLDRPFEAAGGVIPLPPKYSWFDLGLTNWSLRDSNLDVDFPTNARNAEANYKREGGHVPVQGVIAITPALIQRAFAITGPIVVPEYHETVNAQNLIERIHYHQLVAADGPDTIASPDGHSSLRKRFTELLAEHFLARIRQVAPAHIGQVLQILASAVRMKDMQIYFNDATAETQLHTIQYDAALEGSPGDSLLIVDANISASKANAIITNTLSDSVVIDTEGNAIHHTTLHYDWTAPGKNYGNPLYRDYVRVYVPTGSELQQQSRWQPRGSSNAFGHEVWAGFFTLYRGHTNTITLTWKVPHAATHTAQGWHYQDLIQRQAGALWQVHVQVVLPACATMQDTSGGMKATGKRTAIRDQALTENTLSTIDYTC